MRVFYSPIILIDIREISYTTVYHSAPTYCLSSTPVLISLQSSTNSHHSSTANASQRLTVGKHMA